MLPVQPNKSLIDGMACLQAIAVGGRPIGVRELARPLGLETTRVHRLLKTLAHMGFARQTADRKYEPGPGMHVLFAQSLLGSGLLRRASAPLTALGEHGLHVALGVLWKDRVCYLYHSGAGGTFSDALGGRGVYPATRSSIGLVLLSWRDESEVRETYRDAQIPGFANLKSLLAELRLIRQQGYSEVITATKPRDATLAIPLGDHPEAAIALAGRTPAARRPVLLSALLEAAIAIRTGASADAVSIGAHRVARSNGGRK